MLSDTVSSSARLVDKHSSSSGSQGQSHSEFTSDPRASGVHQRGTSGSSSCGSSSYAEALGHLWSEGCLTDSAHHRNVVSTGVPSYRRTEEWGPRCQLRTFVVAFVIAGASLNFFGKTGYMLVQSEDDETLPGMTRWTSFILVLGSFIACAIPPSLQVSNWRVVSSQESNVFAMLCFPSLCDVLITGARYVALIFLPPAVVAIVKASVQLVVLACINSCRGKKLTSVMWSALFFALLGDCIVVYADFIQTDLDDFGGGGRRMLDFLIVIASGALGAVRNSLEEWLLQDCNISAGALLLMESWFSAIFTIFVGLAIYLVCSLDENSADLSIAWKVLGVPGFAPCFAAFLVATYMVDFGKFKVMCYGSAMLAKMIALLSPFGTWLICLVAYYATFPGIGADKIVLGEGWMTSSSAIRLVGMSIMVASITVFMTAKKPVQEEPGTTVVSSITPSSQPSC